MQAAPILLVLLACAPNLASTFSHRQVLQAAPINQSSTNQCTLREINSDTKCGSMTSTDNRDSGAQVFPDTNSLPVPETDANQLGGLTHFQVWTYSVGSAFFISLSGLWGYLLLPLLNGAYQDHVMNVLVGLSCGSLVTSSLCQLIPEAYELWLLSPNYLHISIFSMAGVWFILVVQNFSVILRKVTIENEQRAENTNKMAAKKSDSHQKSRNGGPSLPLTDVEATHPLFPNPQSDIFRSKLNLSLNSTATAPTAENELKVPPALISQRRCSFQSLKLNEKAKLSKLAIIILAGDFMNNFMDGISIGAGYAYLLSTGLKLTTAISFEEYTHKLGDFAIVFQSGISMKRVLFWNYITSCACFLGIIIGIALGNLHWSKYIFSLASGLFLYIALSNMIPEMQNMLEHSLSRSKKIAIISLIEQHVGFLLAFVALLVISLLLNGNPTKP